MASRPSPALAPAPFLNGVGGKRQLLEQFAPFFPVPGSYATCHEPFIGAGAVFFRILSPRAILPEVLVLNK